MGEERNKKDKEMRVRAKKGIGENSQGKKEGLGENWKKEAGRKEGRREIY